MKGRDHDYIVIDEQLRLDAELFGTTFQDVMGNRIDPRSVSLPGKRSYEPDPKPVKKPKKGKK